MAHSNGSLLGLNVLVPFATIVLLVVVLRYTEDVLVPLCLAMLLTFILSPVVDGLESAGLWRIPSVIIVSVLFVLAAGGLSWLVGRQIVSVVLLVFIFANRETLRGRIFRLVGRGHLTATTRAFNEAAGRASQYLLFQSIVNLCYGALLAFGLDFLGMPNPICWGVLSGLLR